jgi:hypothetical protein
MHKNNKTAFRMHNVLNSSVLIEGNEMRRIKNKDRFGITATEMKFMKWNEGSKMF